jgi:3-methyladenine DNA glycosylase AlkD
VSSRRNVPAAARPTLAAARRALREAGNPADAEFLQRFFKTGPGQYGEGDQFLGIRVPATRRLTREFRDLSLPDVETLLHDKWHEARLLALTLLDDAYARGDSAEREAIFRLYLRNTDYINNWDLVDGSAPGIVGAHLATRSRTRLDNLARSKKLWERRIAIIATLHFIRHNEFDDTFRIAALLLGDSHDLIHKAVGWMLREVGKRDRARLEEFLDEHTPAMPRTALRYAIERMTPTERGRYMAIPYKRLDRKN